MNSACPYCQKDIGKQITRKINCIFCKKTIYVRQNKAITEREKEIFDWQKYMDFLVPDIEEIRQVVEKNLTQRFHSEPSVRDLIWGMFNYVLLHLKKPDDLSIIYQNMSQFLKYEGKIEQAKEMMRQVFKMRIMSSMEHGWDKSVKIQNYQDAFVCSECKKYNNQVFLLNDAYKEVPLPIHNCTNKECRCTFEFISKYDNEINTSNSDIIVQLNTSNTIHSNIKSNYLPIKVIAIILFIGGLPILPVGLIFWAMGLFLLLAIRKSKDKINS